MGPSVFLWSIPILSATNINEKGNRKKMEINLIKCKLISSLRKIKTLKSMYYYLKYFILNRVEHISDMGGLTNV